MTEDRLVDIETKIAYQEDTIQELNKVVCQQQKQIQRLEAICESLIEHVRDLRDAVPQGGAANERPPHY
jgi:SlyX protein